MSVRQWEREAIRQLWQGDMGRVMVGHNYSGAGRQ
jgi:hypothetical protein